MKVSFSSSFLADLERIDNVVKIDRCKIGSANYNPQVIYHEGLMQICLIGVAEGEIGRLEFYYNGELTEQGYSINGELAFVISSDSPIRLNPERTIFEFNIGRPISAEIRCPWLTDDTKFLESIGLNLGNSLYKDIQVSQDSLIWKESIGKYIVDRGLQDNHSYDIERLDTKSGIFEDRPIRFKSYQNIIIDQGNWIVESIKNTVTQKHEVYSEISSSLFYVWNSPMIDAVVNYDKEPECIEHLGEYLDPGNVVFGNTDCFQYINFQSGVLKGFRITGTEGSEVEIRFNKEYTDGSYTTFKCKIGSDGIEEVRIDKLPFTHLNGIVTYGPSKITKIETIQYIEEPVEIIVPNPDKTYVVEINNVDPYCTVEVNATCDYIEYEKYLGVIKEIGRGTDHINSIPDAEIIMTPNGDGGLDSEIKQLEKQIICNYNSSTLESIHYDIFQVIIKNNITVSGNSLVISQLESDYKIKIEQTGIVWKITNSPDYVFTQELIGGGTKEYGIYLLEYSKNSTRVLKILTNRLDYLGGLSVDLDSAVEDIFNITISQKTKYGSPDPELIDGEYWNVYYINITTKGDNDEVSAEWRPQDGDEKNPYVINLLYDGTRIDSLSFCAAQLNKIDPKIEIWEETLPGKFTKVESGVMTIFNSMVKNFIVVKKRTDEPEGTDTNWYYYDLNGTNNFYQTDLNSTITNVGIEFLNSDTTGNTILDIGTRDLRLKHARVINVNRSDLINSLGVLTVTENSSYPGSWRDLINNNTANVEVTRELSNIYIQVGPYPPELLGGEDVLKDQDYILEVSEIGVYTIKVKSNFKYIMESNKDGYLRFIDSDSSGLISYDDIKNNIEKRIFSDYNSVKEFRIALTRLDEEEGLKNSYIEIRSGSIVRKVTIEVKDLNTYHNYAYSVGGSSISKPNLIRIFNNGTLSPESTKNINFYYVSTTTPSLSYVDVNRVNDSTNSVFYPTVYSYHKTTSTFTIPNSLSLSYSKFPIKSFGGLRESSLSYSEAEGNYLEYLFFMKGKGHYLWCVDNINDFSGIGDVNGDDHKDIFIDASGSEGRSVYIISRYGISNKTFTTKYPDDSNITIKRNDLEASLKISPQEKIALDVKSQIEYSIPIQVNCNIKNNGGNVFIGSLNYTAETKVSDSSIEDIIELPDNIIDQELGTSPESIEEYLTDYLVGVNNGSSIVLPKQEFTVRIFQRGLDPDVYRIFSDITDFSVNEETQYIIPEIGTNVEITDLSIKVGNTELVGSGGTNPLKLGRLTFTQENSSKYFLVTVHGDDVVGDNDLHWFSILPNNLITTELHHIAISSNSGNFSYSKTIVAHGYNHGLIVSSSDGEHIYYGFGNAKSEKNRKAWSPAVTIPAEGGKVLIKAGIFYAVDGKQSTEALSVPFEYKFIGENIPDSVVWEGGNLDEVGVGDVPGGNLYITVPPRLRDDYGTKNFILQVTQPHEYYPLNLYINFAQESFYTSESGTIVEDVDQENYKLMFEKKELNIYSSGKVDGESDKLYFTHNLNEEAFNRVTFDWIGRTYEEEGITKTCYIPDIPDELDHLEELERSYKDGYVRFNFKPNGSKEYIRAKIRAKYRRIGATGQYVDDNFVIIGELEVNQGYYCVEATYRNPYMLSRIEGLIDYTVCLSRLSPKMLITGIVPGKLTRVLYSGECPCLSNKDNSDATLENSRGRGVIYVRAYRKEFYQETELTYLSGSLFLEIFKEINLLGEITPSTSLESSGISIVSEYLTNDYDAKLSPKFKPSESIYITATDFSSGSDNYSVPYLDLYYKCKEDYIRENISISTSCKLSLIEEDTGDNVDFYFTFSEEKIASDEPPKIDLLKFSDDNLKFDYRGGTKQVSFSPVDFEIKVLIMPEPVEPEPEPVEEENEIINSDSIEEENSSLGVEETSSVSNGAKSGTWGWGSFEVLENAIQFVVAKNTTHYRNIQARINVLDLRKEISEGDYYVMGVYYVNIEQEPNTGGSPSASEVEENSEQEPTPEPEQNS